MLKRFIKKVLFSIRPVRRLREELETYKTYHPPGHYYSPVPDKEYVRKNADRIFDRSSRTVEGIELREDEQKRLLESFAGFYSELDFPLEKSAGYRYWYKNALYSYSDAILLYCMIRHLSPARIIEAGSGFSSALMLDTNEKYFNNSISLTFIEPFTGRLDKLTEGFEKKFRLEKKLIQDMPLEFFSELEANDILFIDSTHVSKTGSDVNYILFKILPVLKEGVYIHFHDVFYPFEYPAAWVEKGFAWNEDYILRAFLQYNNQFSIVLFNTFMEQFHKDWFHEHMPLCMKNPGGSLWLKKNKTAVK